MKLHTSSCCCISVFLLLYLSFSCDDHSIDMNKVLESCRTSVSQYPDSISRLLDSIYFNRNLSDKQLKKYLLIKIQAKDLLMENISQDTLIYSVKSYYLKSNDFESMALAAYYSGRVREENQQNKEAMSEYLEAEKYAGTINNDNLYGLIQNSIGSLLSKQSRNTEAAKRYLKSVGYFNNSGNKDNLLKTYSLLGDIYLLKPDTDSAIYFYQKGVQLSQLSNDSLNLAGFMQSTGLAYKQAGDFRKAINSFRNSCKFLTDYTAKSKLSLNLAGTLSAIHKQDSALYSIGKSLKYQQQTGDLSLLAEIYKTLSDIEAENSNHYQSLLFHQTYKEYLELLHNERNNGQLADLQARLSSEQACNRNHRSKLERQTIYLMISISLLITGAVIFYFYCKSVRQKKIIWEKEKSVYQAEARIYQLMKMSQDYTSKDESFRNILLRHFDILKKSALLEIYVKGDNPQDFRLIKVFNSIVYGQETLDWGLLYQAMNEVNNGFFDKLKTTYTNLDESEFRICCMTYARFSCPEIAIIMRLSSNTVQMKRSSIRKKIGAGAQENIHEYLDKQFLL